MSSNIMDLRLTLMDTLTTLGDEACSFLDTGAKSIAMGSPLSAILFNWVSSPSSVPALGLMMLTWLSDDPRAR